MINKKNIWFLTLFSLILALSAYYITMPSETLLDVYNNLDETSENEEVAVEETDIIAVYHLENEVEISKELDLLKMKLVDSKATIEEKNEAYDKMRNIENNKTTAFEIEDQLEQEVGYKSFVKILDDKIVVNVKSSKYDVSLANKIMQIVQKNFKETKYITVKFE